MTQGADIDGLIQAVALRDRQAFGQLYEQTSSKLFGVCLQLLRDRADAEEVLQEAYVRIWQRADRYASNGLSPMGWLVTLTRNIAIDRLRARRAPTEALDRVPEPADKGVTPEGAAVAASEAERVTECMDELEPAHSDAVRGAYLKGESYEDLADRHAVPLNTMRSWLRRSLKKLKDCLSR